MCALDLTILPSSGALAPQTAAEAMPHNVPVGHGGGADQIPVTPHLVVAMYMCGVERPYVFGVTEAAR